VSGPTWETIRQLYEDLFPELTILVDGDQVDHLRARIDEEGFAARVTVKASPYAPEGHALIINETKRRKTLRRGEQS